MSSPVEIIARVVYENHQHEDHHQTALAILSALKREGKKVMDREPTASALRLEDVKAWMIDGPKPSHICIQERSGWKLAACGLWTPNGSVAFDRPKRICKRCREALPRLRAAETKSPPPE